MSHQAPRRLYIDHNVAVATYPTHRRAEAAVRELQKAGFDMRGLSIVGKDYQTEEHVTGYYNTGDRMMAWGKFGVFWGGLWGLLFGSAFFLIPGIGPVLMAGPLVAAIVSGLETAAVVGGVSVLAAALVSLGVPENSAVAYEAEVRAGKFILIVHGSEEEIAKAEALLQSTHHQEPILEPDYPGMSAMRVSRETSGASEVLEAWSVLGRQLRGGQRFPPVGGLDAAHESEGLGNS
jgi:hypothetical protein